MSSIINKEIYEKRQSPGPDSQQTSNQPDISGSTSSENDNSGQRLTTNKEETMTIKGGSADIPKGRHLHSLAHVQSSDHVFLGSSILKGSQSSGNLHLYKTFQHAVDNIHGSYIDMEEGFAAHILPFQNSFLDKIAVCLESGCVSILDHNLSLIKRIPVASGPITASTLNDDESKLYCSSRDGSISIVDLKELKLEKKFENAHATGALGIDKTVKGSDLFVTCGQDQLVRLWDPRVSNPVFQIIFLRASGTTIKWSLSQENVFFVGSNHGRVIAYDIREITELFARQYDIGRVHRIKTVASCSKYAASGFSNELVVLEDKTLEPLEKLSTPKDHIIRDFIEVNGAFHCVGLNSNKIVSIKKCDDN